MAPRHYLSKSVCFSIYFEGMDLIDRCELENYRPMRMVSSIHTPDRLQALSYRPRKALPSEIIALLFRIPSLYPFKATLIILAAHTSDPVGHDFNSLVIHKAWGGILTNYTTSIRYGPMQETNTIFLQDTGGLRNKRFPALLTPIFFRKSSHFELT